MYIIDLINKILAARAKRIFLKNVSYNGDLSNIEILRHVRARPFSGSTSNDIQIEDGFRFFSGAIVSQNGGKIYIGRNVQIGFNCLIGSSNSVTIGDYSLFADYVTIMDNNNHPVNPFDRIIMNKSESKSNYRGWKYSVSAPVKIGKNVWCGANVRINKGVTIGDGAVIAANTVVVKDVPSNSICAGNPGRIVKEHIDTLPRLIPNNAI